MNSKQRKTLGAIFSKPVPQNIRWTDVEALIKALHGEVRERRGSRVELVVDGMTAVFHRPHPHPEMDRNAVRDLRRFLESAGVEV